MAALMPATKLAELLRSGDPQKKLFAQIVGERLVLGNDPMRPICMVDFSKEAIVPLVVDHAEPASHSVPDDSARSSGTRFTRRSGDYWFEIKGKRTECGSLKELLSEALRALERYKPGTLENLARIRGRSRRIVARDANQLFDKPHLVKEYAERLVGGWFYGTNNSARETNVWLQRAATECAGLSWGTDFKTSLSLTIDDLL